MAEIFEGSKTPRGRGKDTLTIAQVASALGCGTRRVRELRAEGKLVGVKQVVEGQKNRFVWGIYATSVQERLRWLREREGEK